MKKFSTVLSAIFFMANMLASSYVTAAADSPPSYACCMQYGSFYTKNEAAVAPEHPILFDKELVCSSKGIEHPNGTGDFIIKEPGVYRITYSVSLKPCDYTEDKNGQYRNVALTLNGRVVRGSEMFIGEGDQLSTLSLLVKVCGTTCCDHTLRIINNNSVSDGWHNIYLESGPSGGSVSASISMEKVCSCPADCCCKGSSE